MQLRPLFRNLPHLLALILGAVVFAEVSLASGSSSPGSRRFPDIVLITVDTLRVDRVSAYDYTRPTTPHLDKLIARGVRFTEARVAEPLTAPSMVSMVTSLYPHEHGTSRNGLRMRKGLPSLPGVLKRRGYVAAAFVSNWTLRDKISGLGEHFQNYQEVFTRKRWYLFAKEADGGDVTDVALEWIDDHLDADRRRPFLAWVHYVEPHAPYRFHEQFAEGLGIKSTANVSVSDRYDTEVAFVDQAIGKLLDRLADLVPSKDLIVVFASDHGESLGEHDYWGHGRHLYEPTLHIPMTLTWEGRVKPGTMEAPASLLDLTPTLLGLLDLEVPPGTYRGFNWAPVLHGEQPAPMDRVTLHQTHRGAVKRSGNASARRQGLLEVGRVAAGRKEIFRVTNDRHHLYDLAEDPKELDNLGKDSEPSQELLDWLQAVREGLDASDQLPPPSLDDETLEQLRALGYID